MGNGKQQSLPSVSLNRTSTSTKRPNHTPGRGSNPRPDFLPFPLFFEAILKKSRFLLSLYTTNPHVIIRLLALGADPRAADETGMTAVDYARHNKDLKNTEVYWKLNEAAY